MTTAVQSAAQPAHPRAHSAEYWRARLGALASRGETTGPRVEEAKAALSYWRKRTFLIRETDIAPERADDLLDLIDRYADADLADVEQAEAVTW